MIIFLAGNISSGKTALSLAFRDLHHEYRHFAIDDCRRQAQGNESAAWALLWNQAADPRYPNAIVETSGLGWRIEHLLKDRRIIKKGLVRVLVECEMKTCLDRARTTQAEREQTPFPYDLGPVERNIAWMDSKLQELNADLYIPPGLTPAQMALRLDYFITQNSTESQPVGMVQ